MRFPAKKNVGCPTASRDFIPRKDGILHAPSSCHGAPLPLPQSLYGRTGSYADVITKLSRINRLPDLFTRGAPRAPLSTAELILTTFLSFSDSYIGGLREARKLQNRTEKRKKKLPWGTEAFLAPFPVANTRFAWFTQYINLVPRARVHLRSAGLKCHGLWDNKKPDATFAASGYRAHARQFTEQSMRYGLRKKQKRREILRRLIFGVFSLSCTRGSRENENVPRSQSRENGRLHRLL